jgi:hypothetical protein
VWWTHTAEDVTSPRSQSWPEARHLSAADASWPIERFNQAAKLVRGEMLARAGTRSVYANGSSESDSNWKQSLHCWIPPQQPGLAKKSRDSASPLKKTAGEIGKRASHEEAAHGLNAR